MIPINILGHITNKSGEVTSIVFKSTSNVSTTFAIRYTGVDDPIWSDSIDTYQPAKVGDISTVTFSNWNDATEKTVTIEVDDYADVFEISETEFIAKDITYMDLSVCTGYIGGVILNDNNDLATCILPVTTARLGTFSYIEFSNCDLTILDMSTLGGGLDRSRIRVINNPNFTTFIEPPVFDKIEDFIIYRTSIVTLDLTNLVMNTLGTQTFGFGNNLNLVNLTLPTNPANTSLNAVNSGADYQLPLVSGVLDFSAFINVKQYYLNKSASSNATANTACTNIIFNTGHCDTWFYVGNFTNATVDMSSFSIRAIICRIEKMDAVTSLNWSTNTPTSSSSGSSNYIRNMAALTGVLDVSFYRSNGGLIVSNCPLVTGLIVPSGTSGIYGNITFTGFNTGFYIDFTVWPRVNKHASRTLNISDNNMTSEQVNHILVDLAAHVESEAEGGDLTGRVITIDGNNGCVNQTSGGYNGYEALLKLVGKGFVVNANLCVEALVFKSTNNVSSTFNILYSGTGTPSWTDGTDTYNGTNITFVNWNDATEKTVTVTVDENDKLTALDASTYQNKNISYISLIALSALSSQVYLSNSTLTTLLHPPSTNTVISLNIGSGNLPGIFDLSDYSYLRDIILQTIEMTDIIVPASIDTGLAGVNLRISTFVSTDTDFIGSIDLNDFWDAYGNNMYLYLGCVNMTSITFLGIANANLVQFIKLNSTTISSSLDLTDFSGGIRNLHLDSSAFTSVTFPTGNQGTDINSDLRCHSMTGVSTLDFSPFTAIHGEWEIYSSGLSSVTLPTLTLPTPNEIKYFKFYSNSISYIDFTVLTNVTHQNDIDFELQNNGMTSANVNQILVDLDADATDAYTGRTINIGGTNGVVNQTAGGVNGMAAYNSLVEKGFTVTANLDPEALVFKTTDAASTSFSITYSGTGTPSWTDGVDVYTGTSVTFANWSTSVEKVVTVIVDENDKLTNASTGLNFNDNVTYVSYLSLSGLSLVTLTQMDTLATILHPPATNTIKTVHVDRCPSLTGALDLSNYLNINSLKIYESGITHFIYPVGTLLGTSMTSCQICRNDTQYDGVFTGTVYMDLIFNAYHSLPSQTTILCTAPNMSDFRTIGITSSVALDTIYLNNTTISAPLDLSDFTGIIEDINLGNSDFTSINIQATQLGINGKIIYLDQLSNLTGGALDLSSCTSGFGYYMYMNSGTLQTVTWPTVTFTAGAETFTRLYLYSNTLGYDDTTVMTNFLEQNNFDLRLQDNSMTATEVNHYLVDFDSGTSGSYTGRTINISGTNAAPDTTSGGYDGSAAVTSLVGKGFTVTHS